MSARLASHLFFLALVSLLFFACDESHSFSFTNKTAVQLTLALDVALEDDPRPLDEATYILEPGQTVSTDDEDVSGDRGQIIFYPGRVLMVRATSGDSVILDESLTYEEFRQLDFHLDITRPD